MLTGKYMGFQNSLNIQRQFVDELPLTARPCHPVVSACLSLLLVFIQRRYSSS